MSYRTRPALNLGACLVGLLGLASLIYGAICTWQLFDAVDLPPTDSDPELIMKLGFGSAIGVSVGLILLHWGWRVTMRRPKSKPRPLD